MEKECNCTTEYMFGMTNDEAMSIQKTVNEMMEKNNHVSPVVDWIRETYQDKQRDFAMSVFGGNQVMSGIMEDFAGVFGDSEDN